MKAEAGIDYLTCTLPFEDANCQRLVYIGTKLQKEELDAGNTYKKAFRFGYEGSSCGQVFVGSSVGGTILQVSGFTSNSAFKAVKPLNPNVSRIDLQVTVWYDDQPDKIIRKFAEVAEADAKVADERTRRTIRKVEQNDGGYTLYIGARTSEAFGRLYDKHKESKMAEYVNALRFEVELKGKRAKLAYNSLQSGKGNKNARICSFVGEWYTARGVSVPFLYKIDGMALEPIKRETSDTQRRLRWLETQVRHTVMELRKVVDSTVILEVLGFFEPIEGENGELAPDSDPFPPLSGE